MQDFRQYDYKIRLEDLEQTAKQALEFGCSVTVIINGEYYDITAQEKEVRT